MNVFDFDHLLVYVMAGLLISVFVLIFYNRLFIFREQEADALSKKQIARLALILQTGHLRLWIYQVATRHYICISETGEYTDEYNPIEFSQLFDRDDFERLRSAVFDICEGRRLNSSLRMCSNPQADSSQHHFDISLSIAERDVRGHVATILGVQRDITYSLRREQEVNQLLMRYHTVFNSALSDMIYYDKDGRLSDINDKACQTFNVSNRQQLLQKGFHIQDNPLFNSLDLSHLGNTHTTLVVDTKQLRGMHVQLEGTPEDGKLYYEAAINPIMDSNGQLDGIYISGRNVTEMVESFHRQQEGLRQLRQVHKNIQDYVRNINYALRVSDVRLVSYYPASYTLEVSSDVNQTQLRLSQLRCIRLATPRFRRVVSSVLNRMDHLKGQLIEQSIETEIRDSHGRQIWLMFSMVPMKDANGRVERYFGMCRNITELVETEQRLAVETRKAQETELLKQSFLTNMSYEIRTPLNTVVGFAELFEAEHDVADEPVFVEEIKKNSGQLLLLVNDILFLSRLDANMIECKRSDIDFAMVFDGHCQMGWSSVQPAVKTIVDNPYQRLVVDVDDENLGKVIEKLCLNAAHFTQEGTIRAKYEYWHNELIISIEDTGQGIDEATLPKVFDRFVRNRQELLCGTGLDLPIVQALVQLMGGHVELQSEEGKGTTARVTIPCKAKQIVKRGGLIV